MNMKVILKTEELEDYNCEIEWCGHYLNLYVNGECIDCRSYLWEENEITLERMLPFVEEYFNDVLNGNL